MADSIAITIDHWKHSDYKEWTAWLAEYWLWLGSAMGINGCLLLLRFNGRSNILNFGRGQSNGTTND